MITFIIRGGERIYCSLRNVQLSKMLAQKPSNATACYLTVFINDMERDLAVNFIVLIRIFATMWMENLLLNWNHLKNKKIYAN